MIIKDVFVALQKGKELSNAETWKNRTFLFNTLVALFIALGAIAKGFGYEFPIDAEGLASGVIAAVALVNAVMQYATSSRVGVSPRS
jgi:hypothetical protein